MFDVDEEIRDGLERLTDPEPGGEVRAWEGLVARRRRRRSRRIAAAAFPALLVVGLLAYTVVSSEDAGEGETDFAVGLEDDLADPSLGAHRPATEGADNHAGGATGSSGGSSSTDLGMKVSDMLPNAKWQWTDGTTAYSDIVVVGTVERVREGATRPGGPEPIHADTPTALIDLHVERAFGHDGDVPWGGDTITVEAWPSIPVGESLQFWLDVFAGMGRSVWALDLDEDLINENVTGQVAWEARVGPDGRLLGPDGSELRADFTAGVDTLDGLEAQANKPDYYIDPGERLSGPE